MIFSLTHKHKPINMCIHTQKNQLFSKKTHPILSTYTSKRWVLFTNDGPNKARELLKFLWVRVCVLGEMGVVAVVIVVVTVFVLWLTLTLLTEGSDHFTRMGPTKK